MLVDLASSLRQQRITPETTAQQVIDDRREEFTPVNAHDDPFVMVVSVWHEEGGRIRARVVHGTGAAQGELVRGTLPELLAAISTLLEPTFRA